MADQHAPRERGILFNGDMVRALLAGTKTQTRRAYKPKAPPPWEIIDEDDTGATWPFWQDENGEHHAVHCPYGQPGDRLWVRETFMPAPLDVPSHGPTLWNIAYAAGGQAELMAPGGYNPMLYNYERWTPSIHMPRWASRITLEITDVRVERLQGINDADAIAEGIEPYSDGIGWRRGPLEGDQNLVDRTAFPKLAYRSIWEQINGPGSWDANPWVWVVEFRRMEVPNG